MPNRIRFYLDEMVSADIAYGLRRRGIDVLTTHEAGNLSKSDEQQLEFAKQEERVLFTMDDDFLSSHSQGQEHAGIIYVPQNRRISVGEAVRGLGLVYETSTPDMMKGHLEFLQVSD